jgi:hypothetical protein
LDWSHLALKHITDGKIGGIDEEEDVSSFWMTLKKREDAGN